MGIQPCRSANGDPNGQTGSQQGHCQPIDQHPEAVNKDFAQALTNLQYPLSVTKR